jgi:hypothetical protein
MKNKFFALGAPDPEMVTIANILKSEGIAYGFATLRNRPVQAHTAYLADGVATLIPQGAEIVFVECTVIGLTASHVIDHHREGDPGYGKEPSEYLEGSSIGQFLSYMGMTATEEQCIIAAADHCLMHAYQGRCPGVSVEALRDWRTQSRATARGLTALELSRQVEEACAMLRGADRIQMAGVSVAFVTEMVSEAAEASAREGIPYAYVKKEPDGRMKAGILSAPPSVIQEWMSNCGLNGVYGDPQRGFAGGYFGAIA